MSQAFFDRFRAKSRVLRELRKRLDLSRCGLPKHTEIHSIRLTLASAYIDALAQIPYPTERNRERFTKTLDEYSRGFQKFWRLVSLPTLILAIENKITINDPTQKLPKNLNDLKAKMKCWQAALYPGPWSSGQLCLDQIHPADRYDKSIADTERYLIKAGYPRDSKSLNLLRKVLPYFTYSSIFYRYYRCGLVHEARTRAFGWNRGQGKRVPCYYIDFIDFIPHPWPRFVIPVTFVLDTLDSITDNLEEHCRNQNIDPFAVFSGP